MNAISGSVRCVSVDLLSHGVTKMKNHDDNKAAVLSFVGASFTLASYVVEGGSLKHFTKIKKLAFSQPKRPKFKPMSSHAMA